MRKYLVWILAIAFAATSVGIALASTANDSTVSMKVKPTKLDKNQFKPVGLTIETTTVVSGDANAKQPTLFPDPTSKVVLKFDNDIKFSNKSLKNKCTQAKLDASTDAAAAKSACQGDLVGKGSGVACVNDGTGGCFVGLVNPGETAIPAEVLAFNGKPSGGNLSFLLWTNNAVSGEVTLPAVLKKGGSGDFGSTLTVTVPQLGGGAGSLTEFKTSVKNGKYVTARCHDGDKKLNVKAKFTYTANPGSDGGGPDNTSAFSKCST
jgi:hypothetical protein